ncbi:MAG: hypothetical protein WC662_00345 [Candidatus Paceibacterota bacterium]|jgi:hypothetical protein
MKRTNFFEVADLLFSNEVGFVKLYFKSSLTVEKIIKESEKEIEKEKWVLDFSDGKRHLGSLSMPNTDLIGTMSGKEGDGKYGLIDVILYRVPKEMTGCDYTLGITLCFIPEVGFSRGECFIYFEDEG